MPPIPTSQIGRVEPRFTSVKHAAEYLGVSTWQMYQLLDDEARPIESQYLGRRRLVVIDSLRAYADNLPTERPAEGAAS